MKIIPCAEALLAAIEAERLASFKVWGRVAECARSAQVKAEADFFSKRLAYHSGSIH